MQFLFNTITKKLFISFGFLLLNIFIITLSALSFLWKANQVGQIKSNIDQQHILVMQLLKCDLDFLKFEPVSSKYFLKQESIFLRRRDSLYHSFRKNQKQLLAAVARYDFQIDSAIIGVDSLFEDYNANFLKLVNLINAKGFKDFGLEGQMRNYAHEIENAHKIKMTAILMLRRHEKDFLLRKEFQYVHKFNILADQIHNELIAKNDVTGTPLLRQYQDAFNALTRLHFQLGINPSDGLQGVLNHQSEMISENLSTISLLINKKKDAIVWSSASLFIGISIIAIVLSSILTYYTSVSLARPIKRLSGSMGKFMIYEGFDEKDIYTEDADEIGHLSQSFIRLIRKLRAQFSEIIQQNKELKKLNDELDRFIYSAAHDLKSPLASLEGLIHLAKKDIANQSHDHYFEMMSSSVNKLHGFIRDITDYARNKRQTLRIERVSVTNMIYNIAEGLLFLPGADNVRMSVNIKNDELYTDRARLEIVLKNLLSNAYHYHDPRKKSPHIKIEGMVENDCLRLVINDNGIGIGKEHLGKIFDMFYRAVETSRGTGIGLFLVKESVKMLRGKISVKSTLGEWTSFYLKIPNQKAGVINTPETDAVILEEELI